MTHRKPAASLLVFFLIAFTVVSVSAATPKGGGTLSYLVSELALDVPTWQQVNNSGFGDTQTGEITALESFNSYLYAGTHNPIDPEQLFDGAQIFRSSDGITWTPVTQPGFGNAHDIAPPAILDFTVFKGYLYASTGRGNASQLWRSSNGTIWAPMDVTGFSDPDNVDITTLVEYGGKLYAGVTNQVSGVQIWSSSTGDNNSWTKQTTPALPEMASNVTGFAILDNALYAAVEFESDIPIQIWRSYGSDWTAVVSDGFGNPDNMLTGGMDVFGGYLYLGGGNAATGAQLWRTNDGMNWTPAITPAFGDPNNLQVEMVIVFENQLYISVKNTATGMEIWRSADATLWEQINQDGFGDINNSATNWSNASAKYSNQLYVGTVNVIEGGEIWRMEQPFGVVLSGNNALSGPIGEQVIYSLDVTNTGSMTDTINLTASGQTWTTTLSNSQVYLAPSTSGIFTLTVDIPPTANNQETDSVTITATSQGDNSKTDTKILTTTAIEIPVYGVSLTTVNDSLLGLPDNTVTYILTITNSGNVADTFNLTASNHTWMTTVNTPSLNLPASGTDSVFITVAIPQGALPGDWDIVEITAVSQGDSDQQASISLTTTSSYVTYLPVIVKGQ